MYYRHFLNIGKTPELEYLKEKTIFQIGDSQKENSTNMWGADL
jgi:hypothetical protein